MLLFFFFFFFKQKTAYEMRISDWSSDVCSSDLSSAGGVSDGHDAYFRRRFVYDVIDEIPVRSRQQLAHLPPRMNPADTREQDETPPGEIGRASCRAGVCQYV